MISRCIVVGLESASVVHDAADESAVLLEERDSFERMNAPVGVDASPVATSPQAALPNVLEALRTLKADFVLVDGIDALDTRTFDAVSWNPEPVASVQASVVLVLDTEGAGAGLLAEEIRMFVQRAEATQAKLAAVALSAGVAPIAEAEVPVLPLLLDARALDALPVTLALSALIPLAFQVDLIDRARAQHERIVMPEPEDDRVLLAAVEVFTRGTVDITFVGEADAMSARVTELDIDLSAASVVSVDDPAYAEKYVTEFACLRAKKGVTIEQVCEKIKDVPYFAILMVHMGDADGMVSGVAHTTTHTIIPSFQIIKTAPGVSIVSSISLMLTRDQVRALGDRAANPNSTPEQLVDVTVTSARTTAQFGVEPRVVTLSYPTGISGSGPAVDAVVEATRLAREKAPEPVLEGPIQFDATVDMAVVAKKLPGSPVAGRANVLVFPSLEVGNTGYRAVQCSSGAVAVGLVLQGPNKLVNDLPRGALVEDIANTVALAAIQAQG